MVFSRGNKVSATKANDHDPLVAFDIGSSKIRLITGVVSDEGKVKVKYYNEIPSQGMVNGSVSDLTLLSECLSTLIQRYKDDTGKSFTHCIIGIAGRHIQSHNDTGTATVPTHRVTEADREAALQHASSIKFSELNHLIHVIPQSYEIDNSRDITNPLGLSAMRLGVGVHLIACNEDQENNLRTALEMVSNNIVVDQVIYNGLAAAEAVLTNGEKEIGVCLIDLGGGTINVAVYNAGKLVMTFGFENGGSFYTRELATKYGVSLKMAEYIKREYGLAHPGLLSQEDGERLLSVPLKDDTVYVPRKDLASSIFYLLFDTFRQVDNRFNNYLRELNPIALGAGYVLTGGVASTKGIELMAATKLNAPEGTSSKVKVRVGRPFEVDYGGFSDVDEPDAATAVGLLRFAYMENQRGIREKCLASERKSSEGLMTRTVTWVKDWLSREF